MSASSTLDPSASVAAGFESAGVGEDGDDDEDGDEAGADTADDGAVTGDDGDEDDPELQATSPVVSVHTVVAMNAL
jgi:hypothetical protein